MHHPWRTLNAERPDWRVEYAHLEDGICGWTDVPNRTIWIDKGLGQAGRRCTLAHEALHAAAGHLECDAWDEDQVERAAAITLLPVERLLHVLPWARTVSEAAEELWVDVDMLACRLQHLHPAERAAIRRAFAARDNEEGP